MTKPTIDFYNTKLNTALAILTPFNRALNEVDTSFIRCITMLISTVSIVMQAIILGHETHLSLYYAKT